jgi:hypothetical protein
VKVLACLVACVASAAALCATAVAIDTNRLALMPLPRQAFGPDAAGLSIANDSGVDSNADAARHAGGGLTAADLARSGRVTGYTLHYAAPGLRAVPAARSLLEVQTIAELYRDEATARRGLAFWRRITGALNAGKRNGVTTSLAPFEVHVGDGAFAFELTYRRAGRPLVYVGDVVFRTGDFLGAVFVTTTDKRGLRARSLGLAEKLVARIQHVLGGKVTGPPRVALPVKNR